MIKSSWDADAWSGWIIVGRRLGFTFNVGFWFLGIYLCWDEVTVGLGPLRIRIHLDPEERWGA